MHVLWNAVRIQRHVLTLSPLPPTNTTHPPLTQYCIAVLLQCCACRVSPCSLNPLQHCLHSSALPLYARCVRHDRQH